MEVKRTAVVLGGYGLIGAACLRALKADGFTVIGVGRSAAAAQRCDGKIDWLIRDMTAVSAAQWRDDLAGVDLVVNAAGALQDGARDDLGRIHERLIEQLVMALKGGPTRFIQISAAGADTAASTDFLRSKARGDRFLMESDLNWLVLRPTLVIGPQAYGGTALLRAAAALPMLNVQMVPDAMIQTVSVEDVAAAVAQGARGEIAAQTLADITENEARSFAELTEDMRAWLGYAPWKHKTKLPRLITRTIGKSADILGWLGWRSPLRSTTLKVLEDGIAGDATNWIKAGGKACNPLAETLATLPATTQERWFARLYLLLPIGIATLSIFWLASGLIGFAQWRDAMALLTDRGMSIAPAMAAVLGGALADTALGLTILIRPLARKAAFGMIAVSLAYLAGGTIWAPDLWADPLGPLVKVLPGISLALFTAAILEDR